MHLIQWLVATGLLPQSVQNLASSQQDLEATRSVSNGFYTSLHSRDLGRTGERERERDAKAKGDELPAILQIHIHLGTGTHTLHVVMQC